MSAALDACVTWFRQNLAWSNSRRSWEERLGVSGLLVFAGLFAWIAGRLPLSVNVLLWGLLLLTATVLLRRGWLRLFGPVLFYDLVRIGRRSRYFLFRCLYAVFLLALLWWIYYIWTVKSDGAGIPPSELSEFAQSFFYTFMAVQFLAAAVLTPSYTAGAVTDEKERKTLEFLLATDLRNREIVLSKLASRLANLLLFLLTGLPILCFLQFIGGVDPALVLAGFAATGLTVLSLASLSILSSVLSRRSRDAIVLSYLAGIAFLSLSGASRLLLLPRLGIADFPSTETWTSPVTVRDLVEWLCAGNPVVAVYHVFRGGPTGGAPPDAVLPQVLRNYAVFHLLVAGLCSTLAVARLRAVALKQTYGKQAKGSLVSRLRLRPAVGPFPMVWKEVFAEPGHRLHWFAWVVVGLLFVGSLIPTVFIVGEFVDRLRNPPTWSGPSAAWMADYFNPYKQLAREMNGFQVRFIGTCVACFLLLSVAVRAAASITGERERQTLGSLLTTPLDSNAILFGKWLGSLLSVRAGWLWLGAIWFLGLVTGGLHILALPLLLIAWLTYAAFVATLGLWFSTVCRTTMRAVVGTVSSIVGLAFGHWLIWACCIPVMWGSRGSSRDFEGLKYLAQAQFGLTPPLAFGFLAFYDPRSEFAKVAWGNFGQMYEDGLNMDMVRMAVFSLLGIGVWAWATVALWTATSRRLRTLTGRGALRRPDWRGTRPHGVRPTPRPIAEVLPATESVRPAAEPTGAVLVEEEWKDPGPPRDDDPIRESPP